MSTPFDKKIFWVHWMGRQVGEDSISELIQTIKQFSPNVAGVAIKTSDGAYWQGHYDDDSDMAINGQEDILRWAKELARNGLQCYCWCVVRGNDIDEEAKLIGLACRTRGVRAMILDVEVGDLYFGGQTRETVRRLMNKVHNAAPNDFHFALNFDARGSHPEDIFIDEWLPFMDSLHPMVYHWHFSEGTRGPERYLDEAFRNLDQYNLPIVPMLQAYPDPASGTRPPEQHVYESGIYSFRKGAAGISYFRLGSAGPPEFSAISRIDPNNIPADEFNLPGTPKKDFIVSTLVLNVRTEPAVDARTLVPGAQLQRGTRIEVIQDSRTEAGGFVWWRHQSGWSAERRTDDSEVYLVDVEHDLEPPDFTFQRLPVDLDAMEWFYYYGNTVFAFRYGMLHNYDGYSQGLHGGVDFGHPGGVPIFAGVRGTFDYSGSERAFGPNRVDIMVGNYRIIYGHVARPISLPRGTTVTPDTVIAEMDSGRAHMHLEIRYEEDYIVNPLLFMNDDMREALISRFPPQGIYDFYTRPNWQDWATPLDQPTIIRGGPVIGPRA
ncbi:MAG: M23 family metallopeptidase [Chloroflexi bacterium]|nr:M23 family metallopeptidase [Chloroflexota bacterium]